MNCAPTQHGRIPLESNPDVLNKYLEKLGFPTALYKLHDVLGLEDWAFDMVPSPVKGVVFLYPITDEQEKARADEAKKIEADGQEVSESLYYTKQSVPNACGTVALTHIAANIAKQTGGDVELAKDSWFATFLDTTKDKSADERAELMDVGDFAETLEEAHQSSAAEGQTAPPERQVATHFIAFIIKDGNLYEMDGRKKSPVNHGKSTEKTLLADAAKVMKDFMKRNPDSLDFTFMALAPNNE